MNARRVLLSLALCVVLGGGLTACGPTPSPTVTATPAPPTPTPTPSPPLRTLTVCMGQEPTTLYIHGGPMQAATHVQNAIYDGPIDERSFAYQPVVLEKLPSLADGDAALTKVTVKAGDVVVDDVGEVVELYYDPNWDPVWVHKVRPAGCYSSDCAVHYTGGEIEMHQMVVTFTLKPGITWADGTPVTAYDSEFSYGLFIDPDTPSPARRYVSWRTASYVAVDERTVVWTGLPGYRDRTYFTNFWTPLPRHQLDHMTAAEIVSSEEAARTPMGYGPFTVKEWIAGDRITVVRNSYYFRASEGLPRVDQVDFRFFGQDADAALVDLLTGKCDILTQDLDLDRVAGLMIAMEAKGQIRPVFVTGTIFEHLDFCIDPVESYERPDFFEDARMRRAIAMCLNRQLVIDRLLYGRSKATIPYIPLEHPLYNTAVQSLPYDPVTAQAALEMMGWKDADGDGIREAHGVKDIVDGTELVFHWGSTTALTRITYMRIFQTNLNTCGIKLILDNMPASEWFDGGPNGPLFGRRFDLGSFSWPTDVEPPCALYLCSEIPREENGWAGLNVTGYCSAEFDAACNAARQALPGTPAHEYYHKEAQRIFARDLPSVPLYLQLRIAATRPEVTGFMLDPTAGSEMWNIEEFAKGP